jgi:hypothetical protein
MVQGVDEYGRTYAADGRGGAQILPRKELRSLIFVEYGMPIDEEELDRIDLKHRLYTILLDEQYFLAPIGSTPHRILDLGTGSGRYLPFRHDQKRADDFCRNMGDGCSRCLSFGVRHRRGYCCDPT